VAASTGLAVLRQAKTPALDPKTPIFSTPFESLQKSSSKLKEAVQVANAMLAEYEKAREMLGSLPPERREEETQRLDRDFELIRALVNMTGGVSHAL
jgi:hypothetical protein